MKFSKMGIDATELVLEITKNAPHIRNVVEVERWIKTSAERIYEEYAEDVVPAIVRGERGEITQAEIQKAVDSKLKSEIRKKLTMNAFDVAALDASANGKPVQIGDETIDARSIVASKLFQDSTGGWDDSLSGYMPAMKNAQSKFYAKAADYQLREMTAINSKINMKEHGGMEDYPWFDPGMITLCKDKTGKIWLLDHTLPGDKNDADSIYLSTPSRHLDKMTLKMHFVEEVFGIKVDKPVLIISKYEGNGRTTILDKDLSSQIRIERAKEMLESADYYYKNNILEERLPQVDYGDANYQRMNEMPPALKSAIAKYLVAKKMENLAEKSAKSAKSVINEIVTSMGAFNEHENGTPTADKPVKSKVAAGPLSISNTASLEIDPVKLSQAIKSKGEVPIAMMNKAAYIEALMEQYMALEGASELDDIYKKEDSQRMNITRSAKHAHIDIVQFSEQLATDGIQEAFDVLVDQFDLVTEQEQEKIATVSPTSPEELNKLEEEVNNAKANEPAPSLDGFDF